MKNFKLNYKIITTIIMLISIINKISAQEITNKIKLETNSQYWLSTKAQELAYDLDIYQAIEKLHQHQISTFKISGHKIDTNTLSLRQYILETLFMTSIEINSVIAKIDEEISLDQELVQYVNYKRGKSAQIANITNLISSGALAIISSSIQIHSNESMRDAGNEIKIIAGGLASALSAYALAQQKFGSVKQTCSQNMLAQIFYSKTQCEDVEFPSFVWNYLNGTLISHSNYLKSRREQLIERWIKYNKILPLSNPKSKYQIAVLTGSQQGIYNISVSDLEKRTSMLTDLRVQIYTMNHTLLELLQAIKSR